MNIRKLKEEEELVKLQLEQSYHMTPEVYRLAVSLLKILRAILDDEY